jgi:hypothetical protein
MKSFCGAFFKKRIRCPDAGQSIKMLPLTVKDVHIAINAAPTMIKVVPTMIEAVPGPPKTFAKTIMGTVIFFLFLRALYRIVNAFVAEIKRWI